MSHLHIPVSADPHDSEDFRVCGACDRDLSSIVVCPDAPLARCGCPLYVVLGGEHWGCGDTDRWGSAYDARALVVRLHPLYPTLYRLVARWEADRRHPLTGQRRNQRIGYAGGNRSMITHPDSGPPEPYRPVVALARQMVPDVFPTPWPSRGDMEAAVIGPALEDVRARLKPRPATSTTRPD